LTTVTLTQDPTLALQAATKQYVDTVAATGIHFHEPVRVEAPTNLNATYANGTAGVGATLTNAGTQAALVIDGVTLNGTDAVAQASVTGTSIGNDQWADSDFLTVTATVEISSVEAINASA
jgi:hypothetical protein